MITEPLYKLEEQRAERDAEIARLRAQLAAKDEHIAELYRAQKSQVLSAKSVEHDIGTLVENARRDTEEIARLREALQFYAPGSSWYNAKIANDEGNVAAAALAPRHENK